MIDTYLIIVLFIIKFVKSFFYQTKIFQDKEYRFDRLNLYFHENFFSFSYSSLNITILLLILYTFSDEVFAFLSISYLTFEALQLVYTLVMRRTKRPLITSRIITMILINIMIIVLLSKSYNLSLANTDPTQILLLAILFSGVQIFINLFSLLVTAVPAKLRRDRIVNKAKGIISSRKNIIVIGITVSYGKSSMRNYLECILGEQFDVIATKDNENTDIGVANAVCRINKKTQILIVEIGAYKKGEIKKVVEWLQLDYAIITGLTNQHSSLFGSFENLISAKLELLQGVKQTGIVFYNNDDKTLRDVISENKVNGTGYGMNTRDLKISNVELSHGKTKFDINYKKLKKATVKTRLLGKHNLTNLSGAINIALSIGLGIKDIIKSIKKITPEKQRLESKLSKSGIRLIDDSYNTNPVGFISAINLLQALESDDKIVVFSGFIDMLEEASAYEEVLSNLDKDTKLYITNNRSYSIIKRNLPSAKLLTNSVKFQLQSKSIVLIEGRVPQDIYTNIVNA